MWANAGQHCRLVFISRFWFCRRSLKTQNQHQAEFCAFLEVEHLCRSVGCASKQTSVSHSSAESEIISLDAGLRMDGLLALDLWDLVIEVLRTTPELPKPTEACMRETGAKIQSTRKGQNVDLSNVDQVPSNAHLSEKESQLNMFEDNEAVIKMIIKGRSPTMRHVSSTHRVALDWLFDRINFGRKSTNQIHRHQKPTRRHTDQGKLHTQWVESFVVLVQYPPFQFYSVLWNNGETISESINQLADVLTKGSFTRDEWHNLVASLWI